MECNVAKTREALERLVVWVDKHVCGYCCPPGTPDDERSRIWREHTAAMAEAHAALDTPARNCDVGTAAEQYARFKRHCKARHKSDKPNPCGQADLASNPCAKCYSMWAQMTYEKKKEEDSNG